MSWVRCSGLRRTEDAYISFKYGESEGYRNGRYFIDFTEEGFAGFLRGYPQLKIIEEWVSDDVRPGRGDEKWLNLILKKTDIV